MIIKGITKHALTLPYIVVLQIDREFHFMCATDNKETAHKLADIIQGMVVESKEVRPQ